MIKNKVTCTVSYHPTNTPHGFHVETTWKRLFPRRSNVESTWFVCRTIHHGVIIITLVKVNYKFSIITPCIHLLSTQNFQKNPDISKEMLVFQKKMFVPTKWMTPNSNNEIQCAKSVQIQSFSGPHSFAFGPNTNIYLPNLRIQSKYWKIRTRKTSYLDTFHAVII